VDLCAKVRRTLMADGIGERAAAAKRFGFARKTVFDDA
jgi:hypothetical protein